MRSVREVVSRVMSQLKKQGVVVDSTVKGIIIDIEKLMEFSDQKLLDVIVTPCNKDNLRLKLLRYRSTPFTINEQITQKGLLSLF